MTNITESFAFWIGLIGILMGVLIPSPFHDFIVNFNFSNISNNPDSITGAFIGFPMALLGEIFVKLINGLIFGLVGMIIGLIVDLFKKQNGSGGFA